VTKAAPADPIYRAVILAGGELDKNTPPSREEAGRILWAALERTGLSAEVVSDRGVWVVDGTDGIVVSSGGEERSAELPALLHDHHWARVHLVGFGARALSIRTVAA
jgi:hypothetical protein